MVNRGVGYDSRSCCPGWETLHLPGGGPLRRHGLCRGGVEAVSSTGCGPTCALRFPLFCHHPHRGRLAAEWRLTEQAGLSALIGMLKGEHGPPMPRTVCGEDTDAHSPGGHWRSSSAAAGRRRVARKVS
ncbi:MAG: hypothetical protein ACLRWQ_24020 [Flavonifractor plautii]